MKYFLLPLFTLFFTHGYSQDAQQVEVLKNDKQVTELFDEIGDSEIKLDVIDLLSQPALNIGYEIINDSYSSYGAEVFLNFNNKNLSPSWSERFSLNPFYRFYFFNKTDFGGEGYFAEVFLKLSYIQYDREFENPCNNCVNTHEILKTFDIAPGVGIGRKWINKKGWSFEYMIGLGRYLFANSGMDDDGRMTYRPIGTFKGGISIGRRF